MREQSDLQLERHQAMRTSALRGLLRSLAINALCPYLVFKASAPHFPVQSIVPLGISGLIPLFSLLHSFLVGRTLDVIALFATEDVLVSLVAVLIAKTPAQVLLGKSASNAILGMIFFGSLAIGRPLMFYVARQFVTSHHPSTGAYFDERGLKWTRMQVYQVMTVVWGGALVLQSLLLAMIALSLPAATYLIVSPFVTYGTYVLLVLWSLRYGRTRMVQQAANSIAEV